MGIKPNIKPIDPEAGFSLVEILVVVAIIAMVSTVVVISAGSSRSEAELTAERLGRATRFAAEQSMLTGLPTGIFIEDGYYQFMQRGREGWQIVKGPDGRGTQSLKEGVSVELQHAAAEKRLFQSDEGRSVPQLQFSPTGASLPRALLISDQQNTWQLSVDGLARTSIGLMEGEF